MVKYDFVTVTYFELVKTKQSTVSLTTLLASTETYKESTTTNELHSTTAELTTKEPTTREYSTDFTETSETTDYTTTVQK